MTKARQRNRAKAARLRQQEQRASRHHGQALSQSRGLRAVRELDRFHGLRSRLAELADKTAEWAGIPIPLEGERLIIEPSYPLAGIINAEKKPEPREPSEYDDWKIKNSWYSLGRRCEIHVLERPDGKSVAGAHAAFHHITHDLATLGCSQVWGIEQEGRAVQLLGEMLRHHPFKQYLLTGMFMETSRRSGVTYIFRKLKPTVAIVPPRRDPNGQMRILCCLCMHPIGYYAGSWAGAMCPTDDVIAHLTMMRGDEVMFWKRCNQIPPWRPEAGL